jgi:hypothetical protein
VECVYSICFIEREVKRKNRSYLHAEELFHFESEHGRPVDPQSKLLAVGPTMIISQRDHYVILSDHIQFHRIKHESTSCRLELDKIKIGDDAPPHANWTAIRVNDLWKLKVFVLVEAHVII